jgi:hypothetical protein
MYGEEFENFIVNADDVEFHTLDFIHVEEQARLI